MFTRKRVRALMGLILTVAVLLTACQPAATPTPQPTARPTAKPTPKPPPAEKPKAAFVYVAPIGDLGWTWAHDQARLMLESELGIETTFIENVPEGPDAERVIRDFSQKGYDIVFATSFGFMDHMLTVAGEFPDLFFEHCSGYKTADNMATYFGRMYQPRFLSGLVAGKATQTNKIGFVAAFPIPEVIRGINAFTLGVRKANPNATVNVVWTQTWFDPIKEKEAAVALLDEGCDVIAQHQDTTEPQKAAQERGAVSIGYDSDMRQFVGDSVLTSPIWNWGPYYVERVQAIMDGTWETSQYWGGMKEGIVDLAPLSPGVPDDVQSMVDEYKQEILSGEWDVFHGPIKGQGGVLSVPEGTAMTDGEMLGMSWFVDGVLGEAPEQPPVVEPVAPAEKPKAAFVYVAPIGDLGWTWAHDQARLMLESELGIETTFIENVPEGPDAERVIRDFSQKGYDIVFATSFGFMDHMLTVAGEFPDLFFEHCSGYKTADNMATYFGRMYQPRFLSGLVAGKATQTNKIGFVAAFPIPEVVRGINAFTLGVRKANPDATVNVVWTQTWFDPIKEKEAAVALLDSGCDVIAQHQDTTEPQKAAQERGAVSIGYDSDMRQFVGDSVLTSPIWNWGPYYVERVQAIMDGTWETGQYWGGMKEGIVDLAPLSPDVPSDVATLVTAHKQRILSGEWDVFCGPVFGQDGTLAIAPGQCMTDGEMLGMSWFVQGVVGEVPGGAAPPVADVTLPTVAFVYVGPTGDLGWTYAHDQGRLAVEQALGVETTYSELVAEGPDANRIIRDYAQKGYDVIFATSFGYMDDVIEVAAEYPDAVFEHCTGYKTAENAGIYDGRGYQGWYLAGIAAGKVTQSGVLGYIAPYPIPEVVRNMNAFALGARSVKPDAQVHPVWIFSWVDPVKEREAAQALLDLGCDVIARESDSTEPDKLAEENGVYAIGYNAYVPDVAPNALLTSPIWNWGVYYTQAVQDVMAGTWTNTPVWWGLAEGLLDLAPFGPAVPEDAKTLIAQKKQEIIDGTFDVFVGPIRDNAGELRVEDGITMSDADKLGFNWLVEGVVGSIPG